MPILFIPDVPEFSPIVRHCQQDASYAVSGPRAGYMRIRREGNITLQRKALGFKHALWYSCLTGGMLGRLQQYDHDALVITDAKAGA